MSKMYEGWNKESIPTNWLQIIEKSEVVHVVEYAWAASL